MLVYTVKKTEQSLQEAGWSMKRSRLFDKVEWWLVAFVFLLGVSVALRSQTALIRFFSTDDAFYYFQTARNFANGNGISFDGIARANGYHPLWMLVCFPVFAFANLNIWLPLRMLVVIQSGLHAASGLFLYKTLRPYLSKPVSLFLMAVWLFSISIYRISGTMGLESGINAFFMTLLIFAAVRYEHDQPLKLGRITGLWLVGLLAALTLLSRLDNIFLVGFMGIWLALKRSSLDRWLVIVDILLSSGLVIFAHLFLFRFGNTYFNLVPALKFMVVLAALTHPLALLLMGASNRDWYKTTKPWLTLLRWSAGSLVASIVMFAGIVLRLPNGGYSRATILLHGLLFIVTALGLRTILYLTQRPIVELTAKAKKPIYRLANFSWQPLVNDTLAYFVPLASGLGAFLLFNRIYFGAMMPLSGKIKEWWSGMDTVYGRHAGNYVTFFGLHHKGPWNFFADPLHDLSDWLNSYLNGPPNLLFYSFLFLLLVAFAIVVWRNKTVRHNFSRLAILPLAVGIMFHTGYYMMTGYIGYREWYWLSQNLFGLIILGVLLNAVIDKWNKHPTVKRIMVWCAAALIVALVLSFNMWHFQQFPWRQSTTSDPIWYVRELENMTEEGSLIGMTGGGDVGYFIEGRTITNLDGLINGVEYFEHLQNFTAPRYLDKIGLDYIYTNPYVILQSDPYQRMFAELLSPIAVIGDMTLYRYLP
jgi:hypothetical protein